MKKNIILIASFLCAIGTAQVTVESGPTRQGDANYFLGGSAYTNALPSIGKGLYFPRTDLTQFAFDISKLYGVSGDIETGFDGMVVYNTVAGTVNENGASSATQGQTVTVKPGFYYFKNTDAASDSEDVSTGKWVRVADMTDLEAGLASGDFWSLNGNAGTTEATIADDTHAISGGNFIGTTDEKSLTIATNNIARLTVGKEGGLINESVGGTPFDFVLKVYGKAKFDRGIVTKSSTYPDYVFDNYFTGKSDVNPNYEFKKLNEVEKFIKENNHLPGVTKIDDLTKTENGYEVDNTQLSVQTLEKVEELYLHVIEQQKEIQALKAEIAELKK